MPRIYRLAACVIALIGLGGCASHSDNSTAAACCEPAKATPVKYASFGTPMKLTDADIVPVQKLLAEPASYDGKYVRVSGTVNNVCPKKGCWLTLHDEKTNQNLFVKFPDPEQGRLIPMDAVGKPAIVEGTVKVKEISEAMARHYKQDAGASQEEIEKITGPQKQISITNGSAKVAGL
jgi:hypothetical protein